MFQAFVEAARSLDQEVFRFFNGTCQCPLLDGIFPYLTELGGTSALALAGLVMLFFRGRNIRSFGILLLAGATVSYFASHTLKELFMRVRPIIAVEGARAVMSAGGYSFPSGHATNAFMASYVLSSCFGKWVMFFMLAVLVGISRVYLGVHYPADVLAGALLGTIIGYLLVRISSLEV